MRLDILVIKAKKEEDKLHTQKRTRLDEGIEFGDDFFKVEVLELIL